MPVQYINRQPILKSNICVLDFETDGKNPRECQPVQLACVMVDPFNFDIIQGSEFNATIKHPEAHHFDFYEQKKEVIDWHASNQKCTPEDIIEQWKGGVEANRVMHQFAMYLNQYHRHGKPILAGYNNTRFDDLILYRLCEEHNYLNKSKAMDLFSVYEIDVMMVVLSWFGTLTDLQSISLDSVREYLGIDLEGGHDALKDVVDTAHVLGRFLKMQRWLTKEFNIKFKGAFNG